MEINQIDKVINENQEIDFPKIANKLLRMVGALHQQGYGNVRIECGMSPSGCHWRFHIFNENQKFIFSSLTGDIPQLPWLNQLNELDAPLSEWVKAFIIHFNLLKDNSKQNNDYIKWYQNILDIIGYNGYLVLYADYSSEAYCRVNQQTISVPFPPNYH